MQGKVVLHGEVRAREAAHRKAQPRQRAGGAHELVPECDAQDLAAGHGVDEHHRDPYDGDETERAREHARRALAEPRSSSDLRNYVER